MSQIGSHDSSIGIASIGIACLLSGRELEGLAASCMFMIAAGSAPMRAAAATTGQGVTMTTTILNDYFELKTLRSTSN
eukprot:5084484-Amphidinium_carterae.1